MRQEIQWWLEAAERDRKMASSLSKEGLYEGAAFHLQQSAEKALKAVLIARRRRLAYTHDLVVLCHFIEQLGQPVPDDVKRTVRLNDYAVETRYPGLFEPVTEEDYREALDLADRCVEWVRKRLSEMRSDT